MQNETQKPVAQQEGLAAQKPRPLHELGLEILEINKANGWKVVQPADWSNDYKIPAITALIHSEVSEALEAFRENDQENFAEELADIIIRTLDCAAGLEVDLDRAVAEKLAKNRLRGFRHGGKRV